MNASSVERDPAAAAAVPERALQELNQVAMRTEARARHRARVRIAEANPAHPARTGPCSARSGRPTTGPFAYDGAETAPPSDVAVLPGLPSWMPAVLGVLRGSSTLLRPEYAPDGTVCDFIVVGANHFELSGIERGSYDFLGKRLSETRPGVRTSGMYDVYRAALTSGGPVSGDTIDYVDIIDGVLQRARLRGTVTLLPDEGLLLTNWEPIGEARLSRRIQERGRLGWVEWDLVTGRARWSQGMRELLGLAAPPPEGHSAGRSHELEGAARSVTSAKEVAADLFTVGRMVDVADLPAFVDDMRTLLAGGEVPDRELTVHVGEATRRVRWFGHAQPEGAEVPESLLFAARNVSGQEEQLRRALSETERLREEAAVDHRVSETFRKALTPPLGVLTPQWLSVSAAYVPSDSGVGGDWYKCRELPDGRVLLAVGDASGHGVDAAHRAVQQRSALAGLAYTDEDAAELTMALGEVVYYGGLDTTATCVVGHLHPASRLFRWASAGHPAPVLVRDGVPRLLEAEHGLMLGVTPHTAYPINETQLRAGDLLLCYTDGVIERRGMDLDEGVEALLAAAGECAARGRSAKAATDCLVASLLSDEAEDDATVLALYLS
ncbi:PP2C family protein-serine/threonine phosphatase [Streptomyces sp. 891-h]|uniref:PP2C family protein-serine/threonine phosphatase n=1 Tax=unclassified Streptomyces TaxID=2593676 RepID=UPI001FA9D549|nr:PP2C family protein-serine/threonine phosphatase [Streptomyces sp. 891-h]UNZ20175.1 serine/threonine-protein phosphatase [Streptomyces sp. 891-h]